MRKWSGVAGECQAQRPLVRPSESEKLRINDLTVPTVSFKLGFVCLEYFRASIIENLRQKDKMKQAAKSDAWARR